MNAASVPAAESEFELRTPNSNSAFWHNVPFKPWQQRCLVNLQRLRTVVMPAGLLFRGAAGMENGGAFCRWNAGKFQFLEYRRWYRRDFRPMLDRPRHQFPTLTDFPIGWIVFQLEREQFEGEGIKISEGRVPRVPILNRGFGVRVSWNSTLRKKHLAQTRGKI